MSTMFRLFKYGCISFLVCSMVFFVGCHSKKDVALNSDLTSGSETDKNGDGLPDIDAAKLEGMLFGETGLKNVYFDYDSYALRGDALAVLRENSELIKKAPGIMIQIEGHCDERGTQEYNLALGERRALAVREHLVNLGISGERLITISYGEENPVALGHDESAWSQNRRCKFNKAL